MSGAVLGFNGFFFLVVDQGTIQKTKFLWQNLLSRLQEWPITHLQSPNGYIYQAGWLILIVLCQGLESPRRCTSGNAPRCVSREV